MSTDHPLGSNIVLGGVRIDNVGMQQAIMTITDLARSKFEKPHLVVTPNLDFLHSASKSSKFRGVLNNSSLAIPDGISISLLSYVHYGKWVGKVSGSSLFRTLMLSKDVAGLRVFFLGSEIGVAEQAAKILMGQNDSLNVVGTYSPSFSILEDDTESSIVVDEINALNVDLLIVALGSPKQELWSDKYSTRIKVKVVYCCGASIDFIVGKQKEPSAWAKRFGFAWIMRLALNPRRMFKRYILDDIPYMFKLLVAGKGK